MNKPYIKLFLLVICVHYSYGCATLFMYSYIDKELFSWQIPKSEVESIKNTILNNGYERITKEDYPYEGAIVTQYAKKISIPKINSRVQIMLSFKDTCLKDVYYKYLGTSILEEVKCPESTFYRNLGITIYNNLDRNDIPEINDEVNKIEEILYRKLIEVAGEQNIVRGKR